MMLTTEEKGHESLADVTNVAEAVPINTSAAAAQDTIEWLVSGSEPQPHESRTCRHLMNERLTEIEVQIRKARGTKAQYCQQLLMEIYPRLAVLDKDGFAHRELNGVIEHAIDLLTMGGKHALKDRANAFCCIGLLANSCNEAIVPHLGRIFDVITMYLPTKDVIR